MKTALSIFAALSSVIAAAAQESAAFDVVSVKHVGNVQSTVVQEGNMSRTTLQGFRYLGMNVSCKTTLMTILTEAYNLKPFQVQGPKWMEDEVYQVNARMPADTPRETARLMVQAMLAERFGLKVRREQKEFPVYALVVIPGTTKLEEVTPTPTSSSYRVGMNFMEATPGMSLSVLANQLSRPAGRPVLDETGRTGYYKVKLQWNSEPVHPVEGSVIVMGNDPGIIAALPQIGLKLESVKRMLESLVIESVSKEPTEN